MSFIKYNQGKLRFGLIPPDIEEEIVAILTAGAIKYPANNWLKCKSWMTYYEANRRHGNLFAKGETYDKDLSERCGKPISHPAAMAVNAIFLAQMVKTHKEFDDRLTEQKIIHIKEEVSDGSEETGNLHSRKHGRKKRKTRKKRTS